MGLVELKKKVALILDLLKPIYNDTKPELDYTNTHELLIAVILSAQCTDKRVNLVTPKLFKKYKTIASFAKAKTADLEALIQSTGFYKNKAKNIISCCQKIRRDFNGQIPQTMQELITLPGVGRKTANVMLSHAFDKAEGICVDTHVIRLSQRLGLTKHKDAIKIEQDLMKITQKEDWIWITQTLILHGRRVCFARKPHCENCPLQIHCLYFKKNK